MVKVLLEDVATERRENIKTDKNGLPIVGLEHIIPQQIHLTEWDENVENTFTKAFYKGDILFGRRRAYLKKASLAPFDGICSGDITVITPKKDKIAADLLPFIIQNDSFFDYAVEKSAGSLSPRVKWEHLKNYEFELPSLEEQQKLAKILWAAEETKQAYKKLLQKTDDLVKAKFEEMFIKNSNETKSIHDISDFCSRGKSPKYVDKSNLLVINQACIYWNKIKYENVKFNDPMYNGDRLLRNGDILINSTGTGTLGRCNIFDKNDNNKYIVDSHITIVRLSKMNPYFFKYWFKRKETQDEIYLHCVSGSTNQIELSKEKLKNMKIIYPQIELQNKFADFVQQAEQSKQQLQKSLDSLNATMHALINENLK